MLSVMPVIRRGGSTVELFVDPSGMTVAFRDVYQIIDWKLSGYPVELIVAAARIEENHLLSRFEVKPSGIFYSGYLARNEDNLELIELHFNTHDRDFEILLRSSELAGLVKQISKYWTC